MLPLHCDLLHRRSPSSRRAWIEILPDLLHQPHWLVALLAEGVDRNNFQGATHSVFTRVALLAEGVDRNLYNLCILEYPATSPSSRRAWIEIGY